MSDAEQMVEAVKAGDTAAVARLLDADPGLAAARDAHGRSAVLLAVYHGQREIAEQLAARVAARGLGLDVHEAAALGRASDVRALVAADPARAAVHSADGATPLHLAVFFGHAGLAEWLLEHGADANAAARPPFPANLRPLHSAVAHRGADAARRSARALLARGAAVNERQEGGYTPLHQAAAHGDAELVAMLLAAGADRAARTDAGATPAALAAERGFPELAARLDAAGSTS